MKHKSVPIENYNTLPPDSKDDGQQNPWEKMAQELAAEMPASLEALLRHQ